MTTIPKNSVIANGFDKRDYFANPASFNNLSYFCNIKNLIERKEYLDKLLSYKDKDIIKVVTGSRRSGKSTLLDLKLHENTRIRT